MISLSDIVALRLRRGLLPSVSSSLSPFISEKYLQKSSTTQNKVVTLSTVMADILEKRISPYSYTSETWTLSHKVMFRGIVRIKIPLGVYSYALAKYIQVGLILLFPIITRSPSRHS